MSKPSKVKKRNETLEVVCRLKPYSGLDPCIIVVDDEIVKLVAPQGVAKSDQNFKFGSIFDNQDSQTVVFRRCALDFVEDLVRLKSKKIRIF